MAVVPQIGWSTKTSTNRRAVFDVKNAGYVCEDVFAERVLMWLRKWSENCGTDYCRSTVRDCNADQSRGKIPLTPK